MTDERDSQFTRLIEGEARSLASFILALVGNRHAADDLFQSTCMELWRIRRTFSLGTNFGAWSRTVARYQVRRHWRRRAREQSFFSPAAVERVAEAYALAESAGHAERRLRALERCVERLPEDKRGILRRRYNDRASIAELAHDLQQTEAGLKMMLVRLRRALARCVEARIADTEWEHE